MQFYPKCFANNNYLLLDFSQEVIGSSRTDRFDFATLKIFLWLLLLWPFFHQRKVATEPEFDLSVGALSIGNHLTYNLLRSKIYLIYEILWQKFSLIPDLALYFIPELIQNLELNAKNIRGGIYNAYNLVIFHMGWNILGKSRKLDFEPYSLLNFNALNSKKQESLENFFM